MPESPHPWIDGEKIPDEELDQIYQPPPGFHLPFLQSHLVIGARGSGKTTLLRHLKRQHEGHAKGVALYISLLGLLPEHARDWGYGSLSSYISRDQSQLVEARTICLLATKLSRLLAEKGVLPPISEIRRCVPKSCRQMVNDNLSDWDSLLASLSSEPPESFAGETWADDFVSLVGELGSRTARSVGQMLLLFDRADQISPAALPPIFKLLSQSAGYLAVVAMRPGHSGLLLADLVHKEAPGDFYKLLLLGTSPRGAPWHQFMRQAITVQVPEFGTLPSEVQEAILLLSRDSVRWGLELAASCQGHDILEGALGEAAEELRENLLDAAQTTLGDFDIDIPHFINDVLNEAHSVNVVPCPLVLDIRPALLPEPRLSHFIQSGLRCGLFSMLPDTRWVPGAMPFLLELPPMLTIRHNFLEAQNQMHQVTIRRSSSSILTHRFAPSSDVARIFVAYRMRVPISRALRDEMSIGIQQNPSLMKYTIIDGHVPAGTPWASEIRHRIKDAKAIVADITDLRPEVMVECGLAFGFRKCFVPVIEKKEFIGSLPSWLRVPQVATFLDSGKLNINPIVGAVLSQLYEQDLAKIRGPSKAVPNLVVLLLDDPWTRGMSSHVRGICEENSLKFEQYGKLEHGALMRAAASALLIGMLTGNRYEDAFIHYVAGALIAKPTAAGGRLHRRVVLAEPAGRERKQAAESLQHCSDIVTIVDVQGVYDAFDSWLASYTRWAKTGAS